MNETKPPQRHDPVSEGVLEKEPSPQTESPLSIDDLRDILNPEEYGNLMWLLYYTQQD